jgi:hypothetical protein
MMKRAPRGSSVIRTIREETVARVLEGTGPHVCVPWTGADWKNQHECPGFNYTPGRGLLCYVIPEVIGRELLIFPGFLGTKQITPPSDESEIQARQRAESQAIDDLGRERARDQFLRYLQRWTRLVKITGYPETEQRFHPNNEDYQVIVLGSYLQAQHGVLSAQPDLYGKGRFLVSLGVDPAKAAARDNLPRDSAGKLKPGARAVALAKDFEAETPSQASGTGVPRRGEPPRTRIAVEAPLRVYSAPGGSPPTKEDVERVLNTDPAYPGAGR